MRVEAQATSRVEAVPVALVAQSVQILSQDAETLARTIDAFLLENPLLDYSGGGHRREMLDAAGLAVARRDTLAEHLHGQLRVARHNPEILRAGHILIDCLDNHGYLRDSLEDLLRITGASPAGFERALAAVQALDPCGVAARSLGECLALQLRAQPQPCALALEIVGAHLEALAEGGLRLEGYSASEIEDACALIRTLNPRPCAQFDQRLTHYIVPDVRIDRDEAGGLTVSLVNQPELPALSAQAAQYLKTAEEAQRQYVQEKLLHARSFLFALRERARTTLLIASHAVQTQAEFLRTGRSASLQPLSMSALAREIGLSRSTVSRTVGGKYAEFEGRLLPLRTLFTVGGKEEHSREAILERMRAVLAEHRGARPLSDAKLTALLESEGIRISRRTVNKYRNAFLRGEKRAT